MPQLARMDLAPRRLANHLVPLVDDIKNFFSHEIKTDWIDESVP